MKKKLAPFFFSSCNHMKTFKIKRGQNIKFPKYAGSWKTGEGANQIQKLESAKTFGKYGVLKKSLSLHSVT